MVLLVFKAHRALNLSGRVDELTQRIARQRVVVAALVDIHELARLVVVPLGVDALEQEALNLVGGIQGVAVLRILLIGKLLQDAADIRRVRAAVLVDHFAEDQDLARSEHIRRRPVECAPVDTQAEIALTLRRKASDRGAVERKVVIALYQELLVVVQHVQPAFEIAEQNRYGLNATLVGQILQPFFLDHIRGDALLALLFCGQVQVFQLRVGKFQKLT